MRATVYTVERTGAGRLSTMAKPRAGDWLEDEIHALADIGVTAVVSLLTPEEIHELDLEGEPVAAVAAGVAFIALPTPDRGVPEVEALATVVTELVKRLKAGEHVVVHCRYGIGRASLLAAAVLVVEGISPDEAWRRITAARGRPVPDTDEQRDFVATLQTRMP